MDDTKQPPETDAIKHSRTQILKKEWERVITKRELTIINRLVAEYRGDTLLPEKAYSSIVAISELRNAQNEIGN